MSNISDSSQNDFISLMKFVDKSHKTPDVYWQDTWCIWPKLAYKWYNIDWIHMIMLNFSDLSQNDFISLIKYVDKSPKTPDIHWQDTLCIWPKLAYIWYNIDWIHMVMSNISDLNQNDFISLIKFVDKSHKTPGVHWQDT